MSDSFIDKKGAVQKHLSQPHAFVPTTPCNPSSSLSLSQECLVLLLSLSLSEYLRISLLLFHLISISLLVCIHEFSLFLSFARLLSGISSLPVFFPSHHPHFLLSFSLSLSPLRESTPARIEIPPGQKRQTEPTNREDDFKPKAKRRETRYDAKKRNITSEKHTTIITKTHTCIHKYIRTR